MLNGYCFACKDGPRSMALMTRAAFYHYPPALAWLGHCYKYGYNVDDERQAFTYLNATKNLGYIPAIALLDKLLLECTVLDRDPQRAKQLFQQAAEAGHLKGIELYTSSLQKISERGQAFHWFEIGVERESKYSRLLL